MTATRLLLPLCLLLTGCDTGLNVQLSMRDFSDVRGEALALELNGHDPGPLIRENLPELAGPIADFPGEVPLCGFVVDVGLDHTSTGEEETVPGRVLLDEARVDVEQGLDVR